MKAFLAVLLFSTIASASFMPADYKIKSVRVEKSDEEDRINIYATVVGYCGAYPSVTDEVVVLNKNAIAVKLSFKDVNCRPNNQEASFLIPVHPVAEAKSLGLETNSPEVYVRIQ